ncbi:16S rRNA (cytosine(1402)-N(4))-methyltransferase RsmH [Saxibacter everestensis]|uniref:Ribosomal RNA small subunit methyltransferase H n=1 Tax=Saxibacter everestensis TaxID=2909229 RepID=A0ABY8QY45_9MICO|nr:16S rRNA (cytosine(1402)-N(4))-methyltransferase RsmH [Brevibacteriaceae bacterium ZFBP1038]
MDQQGERPASDRHVPVLLERTLELLGPAVDVDEPRYVLDATLGMAGHSEAMLNAWPTAHLIGVDRDTQALRLARTRLQPFADRMTLVHGVYDEIPEILDDLGISSVHGMLFDLGVSSLQLDEADRGFAYSFDAPLDMRMDSRQDADQLTAADILNTYSVEELTRILRTYGEERFAGRIARAIVEERVKAPFTTSGRLVELLRKAIPGASQRTGGHPAKRTFQALRIEVNQELSVLETAIPAALGRLAVSGRIVVLSYHSLEDRIVKQALTELATSRTPVDLPVELPDQQPTIRLLVRGSEKASEQEKETNPRAASVRLRAAERTREAA